MRFGIGKAVRQSNMSQYQISPVTEVFHDHHWKSKSVVQLKWLKLPFLCLLHISENSIVWDPRYSYLTSCVITDKLFCVWCHLYILCLLLWWTSLQRLFGSAQRLKPGNRSLKKRTEFCPSALLVRVFSRRVGRNSPGRQLPAGPAAGSKISTDFRFFPPTTTISSSEMLKHDILNDWEVF